MKGPFSVETRISAESSLKKSTGRDFIPALVLALACLAARLPFTGRVLYHSDSARFALAMEHFDVGQMRPHAPGYVLYVGAARLADFLFHDARVSLIAVGLIASAAAVFILYLLGAGMFGRSTGFWGSLLFLASPLFWYNGEMPFTYTLDGALTLAFAYACFRSLDRSAGWLYASAILLALATGSRQNIIILLFPLWVFILAKFPLKKIILSILVFGLTCLAWTAPLVILSGGLARYLDALGAQYARVVLHPAPFLFQVKTRGRILAGFLFTGLALGLAPLIYYLGRLLVKRRRLDVDTSKLAFLFFWIVPSLLFFVGVNIYNSGQVLVILPALFLIVAAGLELLVGDLIHAFGRGISSKALTAVAAAILLVAEASLFLFFDTAVSYASIKKEEGRLSEIIRLTRENSAPGKTVILACRLNTQAGYYLPEYEVWCPFPLIFPDEELPIGSQNVYVSRGRRTVPETYWKPTGFKIEPLLIPPGVETLVLWEDELAEFYEGPDRPLQTIGPGESGAKIYRLPVKPEEKLYYGYHHFQIH